MAYYHHIDSIHMLIGHFLYSNRSSTSLFWQIFKVVVYFLTCKIHKYKLFTCWCTFSFSVSINAMRASLASGYKGQSHWPSLRWFLRSLLLSFILLAQSLDRSLGLLLTSLQYPIINITLLLLFRFILRLVILSDTITLALQ